GFQGVELAHLGGIVVNEVCARTHADLQNFSLSPGNDPLANVPDGRRIAQHVDEMGVDTIPVKLQSCLQSPWGRLARTRWHGKWVTAASRWSAGFRDTSDKSGIAPRRWSTVSNNTLLSYRLGWRGSVRSILAPTVAPPRRPL